MQFPVTQVSLLVIFFYQQSIIAYTPQYSSKSYFKFPSQKSAKRLLTKGQPYYFEFDFLDYGAAYHAEMAVLMDDTKKTASQVQGAYDEKQRISINSVYFEEKQVKDFVNSLVFFISALK